MRIRPSETTLPRTPPVAQPPETLRSPNTPSHSPSSFSSLMQSLGGELDRGEQTVHGALRGGQTLDAASLLALQAGIYRYVEAVDLAAKLVDRAAGTVKTVLQSQ